ncbi:C-X-C motif chemokine 10-like [Trachinotus anak]|uniref:C-X-C motif chemokine 10-like n=1 Tax=Trachinotus anak TaxID=443729 RepID=UPI0039F1C4A4
MNSAVIAFLTCLLVLCAQGQPANRSSKCKCSNGFIGRINPQLITAEPVIHQPSIFCPHTEIIVTIRGNKEKCVDPQSPLGKLIQKNKNKYEKKGAVSMTTASSQTNTARSTRLHTTSKL